MTVRLLLQVTNQLNTKNYYLRSLKYSLPHGILKTILCSGISMIAWVVEFFYNFGGSYGW